MLTPLASRLGRRRSGGSGSRFLSWYRPSRHQRLLRQPHCRHGDGRFPWCRPGGLGPGPWGGGDAPSCREQELFRSASGRSRSLLFPVFPSRWRSFDVTSCSARLPLAPGKQMFLDWKHGRNVVRPPGRGVPRPARAPLGRGGGLIQVGIPKPSDLTWVGRTSLPLEPEPHQRSGPEAAQGHLPVPDPPPEVSLNLNRHESGILG